MRIRLFVSLLFLSFNAFAFEAGKDYEILQTPNTQINADNTVLIEEFFSYGCAACAFLDPKLEDWLKDKNLQLERIPVTFHRGWEVYAKIYYIAEALSIAPEVNKIMFAMAHSGQDIHLVADNILKHLKEQNISQTDLDKIEQSLDSSIGLKISLNNGLQKVKRYRMFAVPTFVVNGQYKTNLKMAGGDPQRLLRITDYLVSVVESDNQNRVVG